MNTGKLQRKFYTTEPAVYDKETRIVSLDIKPDTRTNPDGEGEEQGFSCVEVQIDNLIDYGHIKSQLIEAAFAPKEEFAMVINATDAIISAAAEADSWKSFKTAIDNESIAAFAEFNEYRAACAAAAKTVLTFY